MYTPPEGGSPDSRQLAIYGQLVQNLLSQTAAENWINDLWLIYSGYMVSEKEAGFNPRCTEVFETFRELVYFFQETQRLKK